MGSKTSQFLALTGAWLASATAIAWLAYRRDLDFAKKRIERARQVLDSEEGPIEFAESGNGPAALVIHGAGGGFDQGLDLGHIFLGDAYRIIAPSRFGYLGTPLPADASAEAQAEAHLRLLDALHLETVPVIGVSAGAPSAMQLCLKHPDRCSALVLVVPLTYAPDSSAAVPVRNILLNAIARSDVAFWLATRVVHSTLIKTMLGVPLDVYRNAAPAERRIVDRVLQNLLPVSRRIDGILNDAAVSVTLTRYDLPEMRVPALIFGAADCGYGTYEGAVYAATHIPDATLIAFASGGHLLVGHGDEVRAQIGRFLASALAAVA